MVMKQDSYTDIISEDCTDNQEKKSKRINYRVHIPQAGIEHYGFTGKVDLSDCHLLSYIYYFHLNHQNNERTKYIHRKGEKYVWINYRYLIEANPLLPIKSKSGISKRIKKLKRLGLIDTYQAPENSIYIKPTEILIDIFNYFIESENNKSVQDSTYNPIQDEEVTKPVSPETTGCFPQSEQGVSPRVNSTISNKISNKINNNINVESKNDSTCAYTDIFKRLKEKKQKRLTNKQDGHCDYFYELLRKPDKTPEENKLLETYLKNISKKTDKLAGLTDVAKMSKEISEYLQ